MKISHSPNGSLNSKDYEQDTEDLLSKMSQGQTNILVAVRCRPLSKKEKEQNDSKIVHILDSNLVIIIDPYATANKRTKEKQYAFDFVFSEEVSQSEIFNKTTLSLLEGVLNGYNATVFAYGPTGAGKTYTMMGEKDSFGIMLQSILELFNRIERFSAERKYSVRVSYLEIYNEIVRDLLNPSTAFLDIREDPLKGVIVSDLSELTATRPEEVIDCLRLGNKRRTCEPTEANLTSSRSHAVMQIVLEFEDQASSDEGQICAGKLSLIDLAGSERAANTKNRGIRLLEGANINRSLLALGNCINALYEANNKGVKVYIPYRDSKLTRLLKDSLGGKCRTVMIACVSPFHTYYEDTHNTLEYANRAKNIKTKVERNVVNVNYHVLKYKEVINDLKKEVKQLRKVIGSSKKGLNLIDDSTGYFLKELEDHFSKESKIKTKAFRLRTEVDELTEQILVQENDLNNQRYKAGDSLTLQGLEASVNTMKNKLGEKEDLLKSIEKEVKGLEVKRREFDLKWVDLSEESLSSLRMNMQKHIISLYEIEKEQQRIHEQNRLKYKDLYISILEGKLKNKLDALEKTSENIKEEKLYSKNFKDDKSLKNKAFSYRLQGEKYLKNKHLKSDSILPMISPRSNGVNCFNNNESKIPKYCKKNNDDDSSTSSATERSLQKAGPEVKKGKYGKRKRKDFCLYGSGSGDEEKHKELPKISDKYKQSPYTLWKDSSKKNLNGRQKIFKVDNGKLTKAI